MRRSRWLSTRLSDPAASSLNAIQLRDSRKHPLTVMHAYCVTVFTTNVLRSTLGFFFFFSFFFFFFLLLKVEESSFKYYAELEILDSASCKAKAMKITFQPVKCPTRVQIRFEGARGWVYY